MRRSCRCAHARAAHACPLSSHRRLATARPPGDLMANRRRQLTSSQKARTVTHRWQSRSAVPPSCFQGRAFRTAARLCSSGIQSITTLHSGSWTWQLHRRRLSGARCFAVRAAMPAPDAPAGNGRRATLRPNRGASCSLDRTTSRPGCMVRRVSTTVQMAGD